MKVRLYGLIALSVVVETVALMLAMASAGAGHGGYTLAIILFPFEMLIALTMRHFDGIALLLAVLHYPIAILATLMFETARSLRLYLFAISVAHLVAIMICFICSS